MWRERTRGPATAPAATDQRGAAKEPQRNRAQDGMPERPNATKEKRKSVRQSAGSWRMGATGACRRGRRGGNGTAWGSRGPGRAARASGARGEFGGGGGGEGVIR